MRNLKDRLTAFASARAPVLVMRFLDTGIDGIPPSLAGTNTEFLQRIALEGIDILNKQKVGTLPFSHEDTDIVFRHGFGTLAMLVGGEDCPPDMSRRMELVRQSVMNITGYHRQALVDLSEHVTTAEHEKSAFNARFNALMKERNYSELLELYAHLKNSIDKGCCQMDERRNQKRLMDRFKDEVDQVGSGKVPSQWLGTPGRQQDLDDDLRVSRFEAARDQFIVEASLTVMRDLGEALTGPKLKKATVVAFPAYAIHGKA